MTPLDIALESLEVGKSLEYPFPEHPDTTLAIQPFMFSRFHKYAPHRFKHEIEVINVDGSRTIFHQTEIWTD